MINRRIVAVLLVIIAFHYAGRAQSVNRSAPPLKTMEAIFRQAPDSIQTSVYWYWLSDNISKEGVVKDLVSMKKVGINRAFIGNIGLDDVPFGKVKIFSDDWWEITHTALKTATELGIDIGIFNSPGWSQSGGPWVKPEQSMRYLSSSTVMVKGPLMMNKKLLKPDPDFQDVKVIAYPAPKDFESDFRNQELQLSASPAVENLRSLVDKNEQTHVALNDPFTVDFVIGQVQTLRSLVIHLLPTPVRFEGEVQVREKSGYKTIKHFTVDRSNKDLNTGFKPFAPASIAVPATASREFRVVFRNVSEKSGITEIKLSSAPLVDDYIEKTLTKMWQTPYPYWSAYQWPLQPEVESPYVIDPEMVVDISRYMLADGTLKWTVPPGNWVIERSGMAPTQVHNAPATPEGRGLETDKMSKKHIAAHFDAFLGEIMGRVPAEDRKSWKVTVADSYETGGQNWSDELIVNFQACYGYSPLPYIPVLQGKVVGSADRSNRFLWDLRRFIADQLAYQYVGGLRDISRQHGLTTWLENYGHGGFPGEFLQYGGQSDEVSGEFWNETSLGEIENRAASSCAHIYGKTKVSSESFTCAIHPFMRYPAMMKQRADRYFTEGVNNTLLHVYVQQPAEGMPPGLNAWFGNEFNRNNTWFYEMGGFIKYLKRCNYLLQQGKYVADVAYFISEDAPKMTGVQDPALPQGYSFDYINAEVLKGRATVENGRIVLQGGMSYGILVLPKLETMRPEFLLKVRDLVAQGAVVLGPKPLRSPSLQNYGKADLEVQRLAAELWGKIDGAAVKVNHYGKGMVLHGMSLEEALAFVKILPDCKIAPADSALFIHRSLADGDLYFISNQKDCTVQLNPAFRVVGKSPELWDATTGLTRDLPDYEQNRGMTNVPLRLAPYESAFIMFRKDGTPSSNKLSNYPKTRRTIDISTDWLLKFDSLMRGPANPIVFKELQDWSTHANDSIRHYSGIVKYVKTVDLPRLKKDERVLLDLGRFAAIARVVVNHKELGSVWTAPHQVDISAAVRPGKNRVEIVIVNTWVNRLIGDTKLEEKDRGTWVSFDMYGPKSKLQPSGLLGPVRVEVVGF